jgi:hypothetical protein
MMHELREEELDPETIPEEWLQERMRNLRNALLAECDWTQVNDAPVDQQAWMAYRQALRDFPSTWEPSETAEFPDPPA